MSKGKQIGGIILIVFGTILLVIGIAIGGLFGAVSGSMDEATEQFAEEIEKFRSRSVSTWGIITDIDSEGVGTIEYYCAEDGWTYETRSAILSEQYYVGSKVEVCYNPDDPTEVMVPALYMDAMGMVDDTVMPVMIGIGVAFGLIGLLMLICGIVLLINNKKDKKWVDEINARNAAQGIGRAQFNGYQQMPGGYQQGGQPGGYQQMPGGYRQSGQPGGYPPDPYQQNNQNR